MRDVDHDPGMMIVYRKFIIFTGKMMLLLLENDGLLLKTNEILLKMTYIADRAAVVLDL